MGLDPISQVHAILNVINELFPNCLYQFIFLITGMIAPASPCSIVHAVDFKISVSNHLVPGHKDMRYIYLSC